MRAIDKIKRLATNAAATNGERQAAVEALRRKGVALDIEPSNGISDNESDDTLVLNEITLTPLMMITPTAECIYAPSRLQQPMTFTLEKWLKMKSQTMLVSLADDGKSNPQKTACYASSGNYWMAQ